MPPARDNYEERWQVLDGQYEAVWQQHRNILTFASKGLHKAHISYSTQPSDQISLTVRLAKGNITVHYIPRCLIALLAAYLGGKIVLQMAGDVIPLC